MGGLGKKLHHWWGRESNKVSIPPETSPLRPPDGSQLQENGECAQKHRPRHLMLRGCGQGPADTAGCHVFLAADRHPVTIETRELNLTVGVDRYSGKTGMNYFPEAMPLSTGR